MEDSRSPARATGLHAGEDKNRGHPESGVAAASYSLRHEAASLSG